MAYNTVTVGSSATLILSPNTARISYLLENNSSQTVYLGDDTSVTTSTGIPLLSGATLTEDSGGTKLFTGPIYGIVASSTSDVRYWERSRFS